MRAIYGFFLGGLKDLSFEQERKLRVVVTISFVAVLILMLITTLDMLTDEINASVIAQLIAIPLFLLAPILLKLGKVQLATMSFLSVIFLVCWGLTFLADEQTSRIFYQWGMFSILLLVITSATVNYKWIYWVVDAMIFLGFIALIALKIIPAQGGVFSGGDINRTVETVALTFIASGVGKVLFNLTKTALRHASQESELNRQRAESINHVLGETQNTMNVGERLVGLTAESMQTLDTLRGEIEVLRDMAQDFNGQMEGAVGENKNVVTAADEAERHFLDQKAAVEETSAAITQMMASIHNISHGMEGKKSVIRQLLDQSEAGKQKLALVVKQMAVVAKSIESVIGISKVIGDISERTNLLAMNAAIEAAHAGNSGAGFNVVAGEIRTLSVQTAEQAKSISQKAASNADGVREALLSNEDAEVQYRRMLEEVTSFTVSIEETIQSMNEMAQGADQINEAVSHMTGLTLQSADSVEHAKTSAGKTADNVNRLGDVFSRFQSIVDEFAENFRKIEQGMSDIQVIGEENKHYVTQVAEKIAAIEED